MNNVVLIGRLTKDPELRYTAETSNAMCSFTLAVDKQLSKDKKQEFEAKGNPTADFIRIVSWGKTAELCGNYLQKGRLTAVQGRIQTGSYVNQQGQRVYTTDVLAERVQFLEWGDGRSNNQSGSYSQNQGNSMNYQNNQTENSFSSNSYKASDNNNFNDSGFDDSDDDFVPFDDDSKIPF